MGEVAELLCSLNREVLTALARKFGLPKTVTHKADLVNELDRYVSPPAATGAAGRG